MSDEQVKKEEELVKKEVVIAHLRNRFRDTDAPQAYPGLLQCIKDWVEELPPTNIDGKVVLDKEVILQAGYQGKEVDFRIGGRLFGIREKAQ